MQNPVKKISRFHFITPPYLEKKELIPLLKKVCDGGIDWIQLRVKDKNLNEWIDLSQSAFEICSEHNVTLIINDSPQIAKQINASGVHLGKLDGSVVQAKVILDDSAIVGGTATTLEDVFKLINQKVDYIGLGPYKFTETKHNLSPVLGPNGSIKIIDNVAQTEIPIILIGGIKLPDGESAFKTGACGIAIPSAITLNKDITQAVKNFRKEIHKFVKGEISI